MGKTCFVHLDSLPVLPYFSLYRQLIHTPYDVVYWDRRKMEADCGAQNHYVMHLSMKPDASKLQKLRGYLQFKAFTNRIITKNKYERIVFLTANAAVLLGRGIRKRYRGRYIIDIRDYFMEKNKYYYRAEKKIIEQAGLAMISSPAYKRFLPEHTYFLIHNSPNISAEQMRTFRRKRTAYEATRTGRPLVLSFIGGVRFFEQDKQVLSFFADDERFLIRYIGSGAELLRPYCEENGIRNVFLHDRFPPEQTLDFYTDTDMILNLYGSGTPLLDYALSNKLYYAATLEIPILVSPGTYMEEISVGNGFGFAVDLSDPSVKDRLYLYEQGIDRTEFHQKCTVFVDRVNRDNNQVAFAISNFLNS